MFNLLRMDLYRIKRSRSVYVCFGLLLLASAATFFMVWLFETPQGCEVAVKLGFDLSADEIIKESGTIAGLDMIGLYRQMGLNGGNYNVIFGIWLMLFVCMDYQSGFMKNTMALHENRALYVGSKLAAAGIVSLCYLVGQYLFVLFLDGVFGKVVAAGGILDVAYYISWNWLMTTAFGALMLLVCILSRSVAAGALAAVLFGTGSIVMPVYMLLDKLHIGGWLKYSIYVTMSTAPDHYASSADVYVYAIGAGFLAVYAGAAAFVLKRQDI